MRNSPLPPAKSFRPLPEHLHQKAFDNSLLANIISVAGDGKIIAANRAAGKLLGYSKKALLSKNFKDIFNGSDSGFSQMLKQREAAGYATGNLRVIKKGGKELPCQITSVIFTGDNNVKKSITTLMDRSEGIRRQQAIDKKKEKRVTADVILALSKSDATLNRLDSLEHKLDKEITAKEQSQSSSRMQRQIFKQEWKAETRLKEIQIANAVTEAKQTERSDLGKELHDNINQLLAASRIYLDFGRRNEINRELNLSRSSEYTLSAIEEIRKLAKGLINDTIQNIGLCEAIRNIAQDLMEVSPVRIHCKMDPEIHTRMNAKFNLDVFRIAQEQLNNITKHASATIVKINLFQNSRSVILSITDNGIGFDASKKVKGIGIINIKSRAAFYQGTADFISQPGKGCHLTVTFPLGLCLADNF